MLKVEPYEVSTDSEVVCLSVRKEAALVPPPPVDPKVTGMATICFKFMIFKPGVHRLAAGARLVS